MSFAYSTACPRCRAMGRDRRGDNLAMYDDGGGYCFSCSYVIAGKHVPKPKEIDEDDLSKYESQWTNDFPRATMEWFSQYGIGEKTVRQWFRFNPVKNRHVFPIYENNKLVFFEERNVLGVVPKSITRGQRKPLVIRSGVPGVRMGDLCLVEDIVSALKVSRQVPTICLFGSVLPESFIPHLCRGTNYIWLDYDKYKEAMALSQKLRNRGFVTRVICTKLDPKECADETFKELKWT